MMSRTDIYQLLAGMYGRLADDQSLETLSKRLGWSKFHLHREFRKVVGETPRQHIERLRLERSAAMLSAGAAQVQAVALECGFGSHEVFCRTFRRRFGCSPSEYRHRAASGSKQTDPALNQELVRSVGPCIRQFRVRDSQPSRTNKMPELAITTRNVTSQPILFIQRRVAYTELSSTFAECFPRLFGHCMTAGIAMAGQPVARYVAVSSGLWTVDCAIPVQEPAAAEGEMQAGHLQGGLAAYAIHVGAYDTLPETNAAIQRWIEDKGFTRNGPSWESYLTSPTEHPDPADWRTEVYWPIAEQRV